MLRPISGHAPLYSCYRPQDVGIASLSGEAKRNRPGPLRGLSSRSSKLSSGTPWHPADDMRNRAIHAELGRMESVKRRFESRRYRTVLRPRRGQAEDEAIEGRDGNRLGVPEGHTTKNLCGRSRGADARRAGVPRGGPRPVRGRGRGGASRPDPRTCRAPAG